MATIPGLFRIHAENTALCLANPEKNADWICSHLKDAAITEPALYVYPELCLTGSTCGDLFFNDSLLEGAKAALEQLCALESPAPFVAGLPLSMNGRLYNCAAVVCGDELAIVPKENVGEQSRWFAPGHTAPDFVRLFGREVPVLRGEEAVFAFGDLIFGVCVGEDLSAPFSPAAAQCAAGATVIANPSAMKDVCGFAAGMHRRLGALSEQLACAIAYANAGMGESTTDAVYNGYTAIYEAGEQLAFSRGGRFFDDEYVTADADAARLCYKRRKSGLYAGESSAAPYIFPGAPIHAPQAQLLRPIRRQPFIPDEKELKAACSELFTIQIQGLLSRMEHIGTRNLVIGVSGGLDSTLALLVAAWAYEQRQWDRKSIYAITMPGLGTSKRTKGNADKLMELLGCTCLQIPIGPAVSQHFADIGQDPDKHDICYENSQARERTQILMDYANKVNGIVLGTGDLSELALGFCTYNGDQMSMYNVNGSIPKSLMRKLVLYAATPFGKDVSAVVRDIVDTPVSPELVPGEEEISQKTEEILGSYDLHDFFLYNMMDSGAGPKKLYAMARQAFKDVSAEVILKALDTFVRRFFTQQFKRSAMPDGADATGFSLSPRGGFVCPSDAQRALWLSEVEALRQ